MTATAVVMPVHIHGYPIDLEPIKTLLPSNVHIVEDACQAAGSTLPDGRRAGRFGIAGGFSLNQTKALPGGEGGLQAIMKATIERATLLKCLSHVQSVVERRNTIPILSNVLLEATSNGTLKVMATDPGSVKDFQTFAKQTGHALLSHDAAGKEFTFFMRKK